MLAQFDELAVGQLDVQRFDFGAQRHGDKALGGVHLPGGIRLQAPQEILFRLRVEIAGVLDGGLGRETVLVEGVEHLLGLQAAVQGAAQDLLYRQPGDTVQAQPGAEVEHLVLAQLVPLPVRCRPDVPQPGVRAQDAAVVKPHAHPVAAHVPELGACPAAEDGRVGVAVVVAGHLHVRPEVGGGLDGVGPVAQNPVERILPHLLHPPLRGAPNELEGQLGDALAQHPQAGKIGRLAQLAPGDAPQVQQVNELAERHLLRSVRRCRGLAARLLDQSLKQSHAHSPPSLRLRRSHRASPTISHGRNRSSASRNLPSHRHPRPARSASSPAVSSVQR